MIDLDEFFPSIMPYAPGCPEPSAALAVVNAAQIFCERTRLWRNEDRFELTGAECDVVCAPDNAMLFEIEHAEVDGRRIDPIAWSDLNRDFPHWRDSDGQARWYTQTQPGTLQVLPYSATGTLRLSTVLRPAGDADQLPDFLFKQYRREIADGALADLLMLPAQSFSNPEMAQFYALRFSTRLDTLAARSVTGQQRAPLRTRFRDL